MSLNNNKLQDLLLLKKRGGKTTINSPKPTMKRSLLTLLKILPKQEIPGIKIDSRYEQNRLQLI